MNHPSFFVEELDDLYRLHNVVMGDKLYTVSWDKELLDQGENHSQEIWSIMTDKLPSGRDYYASLSALYRHRDTHQSKLVKKIQTMFKKDFENNEMMTSTRLCYNPSSPDTIIHNYNHARGTKLHNNFVGPSGYIADHAFEKEMDAFFGVHDRNKIERVFRWISGKKSFLWRRNSRPDMATEHALVLYTNNVSFFCNTVTNTLYDRCRSRGVVVEPQKGSPGELSLSPLENLEGTLSTFEGGGLFVVDNTDDGLSCRDIE